MTEQMTEAQSRSVQATFRSLHYLRHNQRRQEHLASLGLDLHGKTVLELGAGIGDHTTFFVDRGCSVLALEARRENCLFFAQNFATSGYKQSPPVRVQQIPMEMAPAQIQENFQIVYCYGLLYHISDPMSALSFMASRCTELLLLETCVTPGSDELLHLTQEDKNSPSQSFFGGACRPTRPWIMRRLRELFEFVYVPATQPAHEEFLLDWESTPTTIYTRAVFIASRKQLDNPLLLTELPMKQRPN